MAQDNMGLDERQRWRDWARTGGRAPSSLSVRGQKIGYLGSMASVLSSRRQVCVLRMRKLEMVGG